MIKRWSIPFVVDAFGRSIEPTENESGSWVKHSDILPLIEAVKVFIKEWDRNGYCRVEMKALKAEISKLEATK